jgi:cyanophycin synthetase
MPKQIIVTEQQQAKQASIELGMPVVIKPLCQDQGRGVSVGLDDEHEVGEAFELAAAYGPEVIIEEFCKGLDYRLTVFQGAVVKIMQRTPLSVVGDGRSSIADLLRQKEEMALKERGPSTSAESPYAVDSEILQTIRRQGYALDDVPLEHKLVAMRRKANLSAGGSQTLVPISSVHPDNIRLAVYLATLLRLDCCGIDLIIPDICQSWLQVGCHVIELNAQPQVGVAHAPEVYGEILQQMLSGRAPSVQLILDLSSSGPLSCISTEDPLVQRLSAAGPSPVVLATSTNLWKDLQLIQSTPHDQGSAIQSALLDPTARSIILIMSLTEFLSRGLPTHRIDKILCLTRQVLPAVASQRLKSIRAIAPDIPLTVVSDGSHPN